MTTRFSHIAWLLDTGRTMTTKCGRQVRVFEFKHRQDENVLSAWATHFRNQYCSDHEIDALRDGTRLSRADYLRAMKFPSGQSRLGPSIRAGDFAEILIADYLEYILKYHVPRTRYDRKVITDESTKGTDVIGFKVVKPGSEDPNDILTLFEVKTQFSGQKPLPRLQDAVKDSGKDELRRAESLNAIKQRHLDQRNYDFVRLVTRFQNPTDRPHRETYGAVVVVDSKLWSKDTIDCTDSSAHPDPDNLSLIAIRGCDMMQLVHGLYERAASEA